jgi:VIT1/CCC1 family predicted Fe2+/Mn2+ transporter
MTQSGLAAQIRQVRRQAVFGLADGAMSITGVVLYAAGQHAKVFPYALAGGVSASLSMAGGEWLSQSDTGLGGAAMMGAATLAGSLIPALPYLLLTGIAAPAVAVVLLAAVAALIARMRAHRHHAYLETGAVLAIVLIASAACAVWL